MARAGSLLRERKVFLRNQCVPNSVAVGAATCTL
jgi:hypothetical protein